MGNQLQADSVHFVLFGQVDIPDLAAFFKQSFGVPPTNLQPLPGGSVASAQVGKIIANLVYQPGRLELIAGPEPVASAVIPSIDLNDGLAFIKANAPNLIGQFASTRLAVVANLVESHPDTGTTLQAFIRETGISLPGDTADTQLGINRRKSLHGLDINRFLRWEGTVRQLLQVSQHSPLSISHSFNVLSRQVDVNSVPLQTPLAAGQARSLFDDLVQELDQCISGGYGYLIK